MNETQVIDAPLAPSIRPDRRPRRPLGLMAAILVVLALLAAACGGDDSVEAGDDGAQDGDAGTETDPETDPETDTETDPGSVSGDDGTEYVSTVSRPELVSTKVWPIDEVEATGPSTLAVRFEMGAEPCAGANVTVTETDTEVNVVLETGLDPNAAAMTCIAQVFDYEILVELDQPLADRKLTTGNATS